MRTGQYKLSTARSTESFVHNGQFKQSSQDFDPFIHDESCPVEYPHLNSLLISSSKKGLKGIRHRSCENVYRPKTSAVNVEQKVRGFLSRAESKFKSQNTEAESYDGWQLGKIVTLPRKRKLSTALSHSALNTLSFSDTVSCISASSGYSSTSSNSSYGSFKSCASMCSSLTRRQNDGSFSQSPPAANRLIIFDNPLYDVTPASAPESNRLSDINGIYDLPSVEYLTSSRCLRISEGLHENALMLHDPVARRCKEYFERRVETSEWMRKRLSVHYPRSDDSEEKSDSLLNDSLSSASSPGSDSITSLCTQREKTPLDEKMAFLRNEIASLTQQDNALFKQLLALHDSISSLKLQSGNGSNYLSTRSVTPSSLDSFTEEDHADHDSGDADEEVSIDKDIQVQKVNTSNVCDMSRATIAGFTRSRKSYAPTAKNRRRSSSVHQPRTPTMICEGTTALVVVHTDDEDALLNPLRPRAHTFTTTIAIDSSNSSNYIPETISLASYAGKNSHKCNHKDKSKNKMISKRSTFFCSPSSKKSSSCSFSREYAGASPIKCSGAAESCATVLTHPPFREALIM